MAEIWKKRSNSMNQTRSDTMEELDAEVDGKNLVFSKDQIEYLRSEFERQRRWVNLLSTREQSALEELERTQNSVSYRVGRFLTGFPRMVIRKFRKNGNKIVYFTDEDEENREELFPSSLLITPELLPTRESSRGVASFVEEILILTRRRRVSVNMIRDMMLESEFSDTQMYDAAITIIEHLENTNQYLPSVKNVFTGLLRALANLSPTLAVNFGDLYIERFHDERSLRTLIQLHGKIGNFSKPLELLSRMPYTSWRSEQQSKFKTPANLKKYGLKMKQPVTKKLYKSLDKIAYIASQCMPYTTSGYAIRTHGLTSSLKAKGYDVSVLARHSYPVDRHDFRGTNVSNQVEIDNVTYNFTGIKRTQHTINYSDVFNFTRLRKYEFQLEKSIENYAIENKCAILHSASNFVVGYANSRVAKKLGLTSIYEIRGFWHLTQATKKQGYIGSEHYNLSEQFEIEAAKQSDYVFTITQALKEILVENGVQESKIHVLPNAVDASKFKLMEKNKELEKELNFQNKVVIGYIGSFVDYEGLDLLLEACALLKDNHGDIFKLLLVGDGEMMQQLRRTVQFLDLQEQVIFTGRIPHDEVQRYYSLIDIAPLPRKGLRVCELVSPLKPFEAMASGKVLITSSVQALAEIVDDGKTGLIFEKDNAKDLARKLDMVLLDANLRKKIGETANQWVLENHSWDVISKRVTDIYDKILEEKK